MKMRKSIKKMICAAITMVFALGDQVYAEEPVIDVGEDKVKSEYNDVLYAFLAESQYNFDPSYLDGKFVSKATELQKYGGPIYIYYALSDMDGDGTDELFIGADKNNEDPQEMRIYGVWTYDGTKPYRFVDEHSLGYRILCTPCINGSYKIRTSGGAYAAYTDFYKLRPDGYSREWIESIYFDGYPSGNLRYYHNSISENLDRSQYTEISESEYDSIQNQYQEKELDWKLLDDTAIVKEGNEPFVDVITSDWFYDFVEAAYTNELMTGMTPINFRPSENLSRAQFATILYRMEGFPDVNGMEIFPDVPQGQFYTEAVEWADAAGVVNGYEDGCFGPADQITREQMAVMMYRYARYKEYDTKQRASLSGYPDAEKVSSFAEEAMEWALAAGLIRGDQGNLNPQGNASRAQCATIIMRFLDQYR